MKIAKNIRICWFKDIRWDKTIYDVDTIYRIYKFGIIFRY